MRVDKSKNGIKRNKYSKVIASGKQVREFAIRRPTRRITQDYEDLCAKPFGHRAVKVLYGNLLRLARLPTRKRRSNVSNP